MPTDYACQSAVELAARGIAPVRAYFAPTVPQPTRQGRSDSDLPPTLRAYLGQGYPGTAVDETPAPEPEPVISLAHGAAVLLAFLDGLGADLTGALVGWRAALHQELSQILGVFDGVPGAEPVRRPSGWQALSDVQSRAQEVLTVLAEAPRAQPLRAGELYQHLELVEDVFAGVLRRIGVPAELAVQGAADVAESGSSLFGIRPRTSRDGY